MSGNVEAMPSLRQRLFYTGGRIGGGVYDGFNTAILSLYLGGLTSNNFIIGYLSNSKTMEGVVIQPLVGRLSDRTAGRLGRRRPFILFGVPLSVLFLHGRAEVPHRGSPALPTERVMGAIPALLAMVFCGLLLAATAWTFTSQRDGARRLVPGGRRVVGPGQRRVSSFNRESRSPMNSPRTFSTMAAQHAPRSHRTDVALPLHGRGTRDRRHATRLRARRAVLCALGLTTVFVTHAPVASAHGRATPSHLTGTPTTSGDELLRQSLTAMESSLHSSRAKGSVTVTMGTQTGTRTVSGDCSMSAGGTLAAQYRSRGRTLVNGKVRSVDTQYIVIRSRTSGRVWIRSKQTHNRWKRADSDQGGLLYQNVCPREIARQYVGYLKSGLALTNLGAADVAGLQTWHMRSSQQDAQIDLYVDQSSRYLGRAIAVDRQPSFQQRSAFDYSRFNEKLTIKPPK